MRQGKILKITALTRKKHQQRKALWHLLSIFGWLFLWQLAALIIHQEIILASPLRTLGELIRLIYQLSFWGAVWTTMWRIIFGFLLSLIAGVACAWIASFSEAISVILAPPLRLMRSVPVVSFIILLLIWGGSAWISTEVIFLMVLPVVYDNVSSGLKEASDKFRSLVQVFRIPRLRVLRAVTLPSIMPYIIAACRIGIGLAWKAGVSAEVIGLPSGTIGYKLDNARLYLDTGNLFALTTVIVILSIIVEKLINLGLNRLERVLWTVKL